jgi:putative molybdopterin biosynthesis protein
VIRIDIRPVWRFSSKTEKDFDFLLIALLEGIEATGKLTKAAESAGISYRHAWNLIEQWTEFFATPLVSMQKGRGTLLTPFGAELLWAGQRVKERLAPELENLASEFARALNTFADGKALLSIQASHDFALSRLRELTAGSGLDLDVQYRGSFDALAALRRGECDIAGFHFPDGELGTMMARRYAEGLPEGEFSLIAFAKRTQGFIVNAGNPKDIRTVADLARGDVRIVNRQRGSGTRALLEFMLSREAVDRSRIRGYETEEITHAAVAALIAGRQADVGFGVQAAAAQYRLDFVPCCTERYYLACRTGQLETPHVLALINALRGAAFHEAIASLPGYSAPDAGRIFQTTDVLSKTETPA